MTPFCHDRVFDARGEMFIDVVADRAEVVHEEHGPIMLNRGVYRVWRQREYDPQAEFRRRFVAD